MGKQGWQRLPLAGVMAVLLWGVITPSAIANPDETAAVVCLDPAYYREQARRFRELAGADLTSQITELAAAYDARAAHLEAQINDRCSPFWLYPQ